MGEVSVPWMYFLFNVIQRQSDLTNIFCLFHFQVTGKQSLPQVLACLNHYRNRPSYLTKALKTLYNLSCADHLKEDVELRRKIIEVSNSSQLHTYPLDSLVSLL